MEFIEHSKKRNPAKHSRVHTKAIIGVSQHGSHGPARKLLEASGKVEWKALKLGKTNKKVDFCGEWGMFSEAVKDNWDLIEKCYQEAEFAEKQIKKMHPDLVVVWNDFQPLEVGAVLAAKSMGIPTVVTAHGSMFGMTPGGFAIDTCADYELGSWATRQMFKDFDSSIESIAVGMPMLDPWYNAKDGPIKESAKTDLGIDKDIPVLTWIGTWSGKRKMWDISEPDHFQSFIESFKALKEIVPKVHLNVCPHPSAQITNEDYQKLLESSGISKDYLVLKGMSEIAVASSDLLVGARSSIMSLGLMLDVPSIILDYKPWHEWTWFRGRGFEIVENSRELTASLISMFVDTKRYFLRKNECSLGASWFASTPDGKASKRIARVIERLATGKDIDEECWAPMPVQE